jgi:hypothetical protein
MFHSYLVAAQFSMDAKSSCRLFVFFLGELCSSINLLLFKFLANNLYSSLFGLLINLNVDVSLFNLCIIMDVFYWFQVLY